MRALQLAVGWAALCGFTAAGAYYGMIELDLSMHLQARLCPACGQPGSAANNPQTPAKTVPPQQQLPPYSPPRQPDPKAPAQQNTVVPPAQQSSTPPQRQPPAAYRPPVWNQPPATQPQQVQPQPQPQAGPSVDPRQTRTSPTVAPQQQPQAPVTRVPDQTAVQPNLSGLGLRLNDLVERGVSVNAFFSQMEKTLREQGQSLRSDIRSAQSASQQYLSEAAAAIRAGNASLAAHKLNQAEEKISYLEQSK